MLQSAVTSREELLRNQIMDAAISCIEKKGIDKTRIGDIAKEMGLVRQTIYNYFSSKNALLEAMFSRESVVLAENTAAHIEGFKNLEDKFVQAFLYVFKTFPQNAVLSHIAQSGNSYVLESGISRQTMQMFGELVLQKVFADNPELNEQSGEIAELLSRNIMSFILMPDQEPRSEKELEMFIRRRLIPGIGLPKK